MSVSEKTQRRLKIKMRIRKRIGGTSARPRLAVYKSNTATYVQLIDDAKGHTLAAFSSRKLAEESLKPVEYARLVGLEIAKKALEKGIETVVFDRSGYIYHGRVKAVAEGARSGGLKF